MRATASATVFSAMSSAAGFCCIWLGGTEEHAGKAYKAVRGELEAYGSGLAEKPEIVALSKADALDTDTRKKEGCRAETRQPPAPRWCSRPSPAKASTAVLRALMAEIEGRTRSRHAHDAGRALAGLAFPCNEFVPSHPLRPVGHLPIKEIGSFGDAASSAPLAIGESNTAGQSPP